MVKKLDDALDIRILAQVSGLDEAKEAIRAAQDAVLAAARALEVVCVEMDVE